MVIIMSKTRKAAKKNKQAAAEARKITLPKLLRIFLKVFVISILFTLTLTLVETFFGWSITKNTWIQMGLMLLVVIVAQPFIMSELRPKK